MMICCVFAVSLMLPFSSFIQKLKMAVSFLGHLGCNATTSNVMVTSALKFFILGVSAGIW
jgi:hypothetical protein